MPPNSTAFNSSFRRRHSKGSMGAFAAKKSWILPLSLQLQFPVVIEGFLISLSKAEEFVPFWVSLPWDHRHWTHLKDELGPQFPSHWWVWKSSCMLGSSFFAFLQSGWKPAFLRGKSGLKLMCVFCLEELSPKWFNMMKLVAFTAFLLYCNRVALQIILKNYVLHELAWLLSPISFKFHLKHLIFSKWHWLLAEHFPSTTFVMALL